MIRKLFAVLLLAVLAATVPIYAAEAKLAWDPVSDVDLAGYEVGYFEHTVGGTCPLWEDSTVTGTIITVGNVTEYEIAGLTPCTPVCFYVRALDTQGNVSDWSNHVDQWARPIVSVLDPSGFERGQTYSGVALSGSSFAEGATVEIANPDVIISNVEVMGCSSLGFDVTISPTADMGTFNLEVINPEMIPGEGRIYGVGNGLFIVGADDTPPAMPQRLRRVFRK